MKKIYSLGKYTLFQSLNGTNYLGIGSRQVVISSEKRWKCILNLAELAKKGAELSVLEKEDSVSSSLGTLKFLIENNFIIPENFLPDNSRYSRTLYYYQSLGLDLETVVNKLKKSNVTILGCGGIGNHIGALPLMV